MNEDFLRVCCCCRGDWRIVNCKTAESGSQRPPYITKESDNKYSLFDSKLIQNKWLCIEEYRRDSLLVHVRCLHPQEEQGREELLIQGTCLKRGSSNLVN